MDKRLVGLAAGVMVILAGADLRAQSGEAETDAKSETERPAPEPASETQADDEEAPAETSPTVRTTARAPLPEFAADRSVNRVDDEEIQRKQAKSVTEALGEEPGIFIQSTNRGAGSVFLRGLVGPANLIYFDGVRFSQSTFRTGPNQYLNTSDPWALRRIEVVRGPGSVLYGSGAMGGVVQLLPRQLPEEDFELRTLGTWESADNTYGVGLDTGMRSGPVSVMAGASFRSHGDLRVGQQGGSGLVAPAEANNQVPGEFREGFFRGGAGVDLGGDNRLRLNYFGGSIEDAPRIDRIGEGEVRFYDNRDDLLYATFEHGVGASSGDEEAWLEELSLNLSYHRTEERVDRYQCQTSASVLPGGSVQLVDDVRECFRHDRDILDRHRINEDVVQTVGSSLAGVSRVVDRKLRLSWGADVYHDVVASSRRDATPPGFEFEARDRGNFSDDSTYTRMGLYASGEYRVFRLGEVHDFFVSGGARLERFAAHAPDVAEAIGDVSYDFTGLVGSAGVKYLYGTKLNAYFNWSQGFRAPNLQESTVLGSTGNFFEVPNDALGPERSNTFELGTKLDFPKIFELEASLWASLLSNKITRAETTWEGQSEIDGQPVRERVNADSAYYTGADLRAESAAVRGFSLYGHLSWIDGAIESDAADPRFEPGPFHGLFGTADQYANPRRLPPLTYLAGLRYSPQESWYATFFARGAARQDKLGSGDVDDLRICQVRPGILHSELNRECPGTAGWVTLNVRGGYRYEDVLRVDAAVENLTDRRYKYHGSGPPGAGINGRITLTLYTP